MAAKRVRVERFDEVVKEYDALDWTINQHGALELILKGSRRIIFSAASWSAFEELRDLK